MSAKAVSKGAGHGGHARGYSWPPFKPGHTQSMTHGAYSSVLRLRERAQTITERLVELLGDDFDPKYTPALEAASIAATRLEKAADALDDADDLEPMLKLSSDARGWFREFVRVLEACGLTPEVATAGGVRFELTAITIEQDAEAQARLFAKLQALGLLQPVCADVVDAEPLEIEAGDGS